MQWQKGRILPCKGPRTRVCDGVIHGATLWVHPVEGDELYYATNVGDGTLKEFVELLPGFTDDPPRMSYLEWEDRCRAAKGVKVS